ncbi:hypothetical protein [Prochlorococcus sp. MIT 1300]|uniref:hypothetical protein n=1 Tax=Prochlorococcus sp. MIT 1300 TaxID=3096218 RepID=UPI002A749E00|nr:hypothetical protein [Prochlorococcus sp. MIT 1300]
MKSQPNHDYAVRYRGFLLLPQMNNSWLVRPERSPMKLLPFRTEPCSLTEVKKILDERLANQKTLSRAA